MFRDRGIVHNYMKLANYFAASNSTVCIEQCIVRFQFTMHIQTQLIKLHRIMYKKIIYSRNLHVLNLILTCAVIISKYMWLTLILFRSINFINKN